MSAPVSFEGGEGVARSLVGELLTCELSRAFAPGAPMRFRVTVEGAPLEVSGKSRGSKRRDEGGFTVRVRLINLRREHREALERALRG